jgi:hypothetical protein
LVNLKHFKKRANYVCKYPTLQCEPCDAGNGIIASISIFEDQNGAEESNKMAANYVNENLASILTKPPEVTAGKVRVYKT